MPQRDQRSDKAIYETNLTPLIDVSLVLVVILLVATPLAFQSSFVVNSATQSARSASKQERMSGATASSDPLIAAFAAVTQRSRSSVGS